jgi:zinc transport system substrate-binding protein
MSIKKISASVLLLIIVVGGIFFAVHRNAPTTNTSNKLPVVASYYPLYDFARQVGGDKVDVTDVTPAGAEPHDYEPTPKVLVTAQKAAVFVYNGGHMEPWTNNFLQGYKHVAVKASTDINLRQAADEDNTRATVQDPHFWLDPVLAQQIVKNIRDGFIRANPANKAYYTKNAQSYISSLAQLDTDFHDGLQTCQTRTIITSHAAFGYLAKRYNLDVASIAGITPDEEPSAAKLAELSNLIKEKHINYVFFESLVSPRLADTIATETGAKTLVFDPIEGLSDADQAQGKNYLSVQRQNLVNLRTALACK